MHAVIAVTEHVPMQVGTILMSLPPAAVPAGREVGVGRVDEERRVTEEQLGLAAAEQRGGVPSIGSGRFVVTGKKGADYVSQSGIQCASGSAKRQRD